MTAAETAASSPSAGEHSWLLFAQRKNCDGDNDGNINNSNSNGFYSNIRNICFLSSDETIHEEEQGSADRRNCSNTWSSIKYLTGVAVGVVMGVVFANTIPSITNQHYHDDASPTRTIRGSDRPSTATASIFQTSWLDQSSTTQSPQRPPVMSTNSRYTQFQALNFQLYTGGAPAKINTTTSAGKHKLHHNPECTSFLRNKNKTLGIDVAAEDASQSRFCYLGHTDVDRDVQDRLQIMYDAVETAYEQATKDPSTLKVFVAPEFFFRGRNGAYLVHPHHLEDPQSANSSDSSYLFEEDENGECLGEVCKIRLGLEKFTADARFKDWLFLFGTAVIAEPLPTEDEYDYLFYNFGLLYRGYDPATESNVGKRFLVPKRYVSTSDFLHPQEGSTENTMMNTKEIFENDSQQQQQASILGNRDDDIDDQLYVPLRKKYDRQLWHTYKEELTKLNYVMIEYGWFMMDGISFTVEICLDHDMRTALTAFLVDSVLPSATLIPSSSSNPNNQEVEYIEIPRYQAQLSLVASAGMTVSETSMALVNGGSIVLQDGMEDDDPEMIWTYECFKYEWQFVGGSEVVQRNATMTPTEVLFDYNVKKTYKKHSIYGKDGKGWKQSLRNVFSTARYEPMVRVFEPSSIAKVY